jgi:hypothetical protein
VRDLLHCGVHQHYQVTKPDYDYLGVTADPIGDVLLIPRPGKGPFWRSNSRKPLFIDAYGAEYALAGETHGVLKCTFIRAEISGALSLPRVGRSHEYEG